ncbi:hypothetical protein MRQ47_004467 [Salmonella enterica]|nr:hypothetical protein [Salmonella enterica]
MPLGDYILLDADLNKPGAASVAAVEMILGQELGEPFQIRRSDDSRHYLFKRPASLKGVTLKQNAIGRIAPGWDLLTGNQICYLKADKEMPNGFPKLADVPDAPQAIIDTLTPEPEPAPSTAPVIVSKTTTTYGEWMLKLVDQAMGEALEGLRLATLNKHALKIGRLIAGGEIEYQYGYDSLAYFGQRAGLKEGEIARSLKSAFAKGTKSPERAPELRIKPKDKTLPKISKQSGSNPAAGVIPAVVPPPEHAEKPVNRQETAAGVTAPAAGNNKELEFSAMTDEILDGAGHQLTAISNELTNGLNLADFVELMEAVISAAELATVSNMANFLGWMGEPVAIPTQPLDRHTWKEQVNGFKADLITYRDANGYRKLSELVEEATNAGKSVRRYIEDGGRSAHANFAKDMPDGEFSDALSFIFREYTSAAEGDEIGAKRGFVSRRDFVRRMEDEEAGIGFDAPSNDDIDDSAGAEAPDQKGGQSWAEDAENNNAPAANSLPKYKEQRTEDGELAPPPVPDVEDLEPDEIEGLPLVIGGSKARDLTMEEAQRLSKFNKRYVHTSLGNKSIIAFPFIRKKGNNTFFDLQTLVKNECANMFEHYAPIYGLKDSTRGRVPGNPINVIHAWLAWPGHNIKWGGIDYYPNVKECPDHIYNTYQGLGVKPDRSATDDDVALWLDLVEDVICNGSKLHAKYLIDFIAHILQHPASKPGVAIAMTGTKGIGKGQFMASIQAILGSNYAEFQGEESLTAKFNFRRCNRLGIFVDETRITTKATEDAVKHAITSTRVPMERKGVDSIEVADYSRLFIASNHEDAIRVTEDERRWLLLNSSRKRQNDNAYFTRYMRWLFKERGAEKLAGWLLNRDITEFDAFNAPLTDALRAGIIRNLDNYNAFILHELSKPDPFGIKTNEREWQKMRKGHYSRNESGEALNAGGVNPERVYEQCAEFLNERKKSHERLYEAAHVRQTISSRFKEFMGVVPEGSNAKKRFYFQDIKAARKAFCEYTRLSYDQVFGHLD